MSATAAATSRPLPWAPRLVPLLCLALLDGLTALGDGIATAGATAAASLLTGWLALIQMGWLLAGPPELTRRAGPPVGQPGASTVSGGAHPVEPPAAAPRFCPHCGQQTGAGARFCGQCGGALTPR